MNNIEKDRLDKEIFPTLREITELFIIVNAEIIRAEEINPEKKADIQVINELRNTLTHLMRIFTSYFEIERDYDSEYVKLNLEKAFGHVYRAGYDTLDWIALYLRNYITNEISPFSSETLTSVFPEYYKDIKPDLEDINNLIAGKRLEKDVGNPSSENFLEYIKIVKRLRGYYNEVLQKKSSLIEFEEKLKKEQGSKIIIEIIIASFIAFFFFILGYLFKT